MAQAYDVFKSVIDTTKPLLYIPFAMANEKYPSCLEWITEELKDFHFPKIDMLTSGKELKTKSLKDYCAIFIGGGNTYKLLKEIKESGCFEKIQEYLNNNGVIFGGSAGAILFGISINSCKHADPNDVHLTDTTGFNCVYNHYIGAHYPNGPDEKNKKAEECFLELSKIHPVIALPEENTLYINGSKLSVLGSTDFYLFKNGKKNRIRCSEQIYMDNMND